MWELNTHAINVTQNLLGKVTSRNISTDIKCHFMSKLNTHKMLLLEMSNAMFFHAGFFAVCRVLQVFTGFLQVFRV